MLFLVLLLLGDVDVDVGVKVMMGGEEETGCKRRSVEGGIVGEIK